MSTIPSHRLYSEIDLSNGLQSSSSSSSFSPQNSNIRQFTHNENPAPASAYVQTYQKSCEEKLQTWRLFFLANYHLYQEKRELNAKHFNEASKNRELAEKYFSDVCELNEKVLDRFTHYRIMNHPLCYGLSNLQEIRDLEFEDYLSKIDPFELMGLYFPPTMDSGMGASGFIFFHRCVFAFETLMGSKQDQDISLWVLSFLHEFIALKKYEEVTSKDGNLGSLLSFFEEILIRENPAYKQTLECIKNEGMATSRGKVYQLITCRLTPQLSASINSLVPATPTYSPQQHTPLATSNDPLFKKPTLPYSPVLPAEKSQSPGVSSGLGVSLPSLSSLLNTQSSPSPQTLTHSTNLSLSQPQSPEVLSGLGVSLPSLGSLFNTQSSPSPQTLTHSTNLSLSQSQSPGVLSGLGVSPAPLNSLLSAQSSLSPQTFTHSTNSDSSKSQSPGVSSGLGISSSPLSSLFNTQDSIESRAFMHSTSSSPSNFQFSGALSVVGVDPFSFSPSQSTQSSPGPQTFTLSRSSSPLKCLPQGDRSGLGTDSFTLLNTPNIPKNDCMATSEPFKLPSVNELLNKMSSDPFSFSQIPYQSGSTKEKAPKQSSKRRKISPSSLQEDQVNKASQRTFTEEYYQKLLLLGNSHFYQKEQHPENFYKKIILSDTHQAIKLKAYNNLLVHAIIGNDFKTISDLLLHVSQYVQSINVNESIDLAYLVFMCNSITGNFFNLLTVSENKNLLRDTQAKEFLQSLKQLKESIDRLGCSYDLISLLNNNTVVLEVLIENSLPDFGKFFLDIKKTINNPILCGILTNNMGVASRLHNLKANELFDYAKKCCEIESPSLQQVIEHNKQSSNKNFTLDQCTIELEDMFIFADFFKFLEG